MAGESGLVEEYYAAEFCIKVNPLPTSLLSRHWSHVQFLGHAQCLHLLEGSWSSSPEHSGTYGLSLGLLKMALQHQATPSEVAEVYPTSLGEMHLVLCQPTARNKN